MKYVVRFGGEGFDREGLRKVFPRVFQVYHSFSGYVGLTVDLDDVDFLDSGFSGIETVELTPIIKVFKDDLKLFRRKTNSMIFYKNGNNSMLDSLRSYFSNEDADANFVADVLSFMRQDGLLILHRAPMESFYDHDFVSESGIRRPDLALVATPI